MRQFIIGAASGIGLEMAKVFSPYVGTYSNDKAFFKGYD